MKSRKLPELSECPAIASNYANAGPMPIIAIEI